MEARNGYRLSVVEDRGCLRTHCDNRRKDGKEDRRAWAKNNTFNDPALRLKNKQTRSKPVASMEMEGRDRASLQQDQL